LRIQYRCGVDADFIRTSVEQIAYIFHRAYATANGEGNKHL
jgi:hypothetical protein